MTRPEPRAETVRDAHEFGIHTRQGGWRLGLLVARNVVVSPGRVPLADLAPKTNATEFARQAHVSNDTVLRHHAAWGRAATDGLVPPASELAPGVEIVIDADHLPAWSHYYRTVVARPKAAPATPPSSNSILRAVESLQARAGAPVDRAREDAARAATERVRLGLARHEQQDTDALDAVDADGRRYRQTLPASNPDASPHREGGRQLINDELSTEVAELLGKAQWFTRRLFDIARDPDWTSRRADVADQLRTMSQQLALVADIAADPESARATDEALRNLLA